VFADYEVDLVPSVSRVIVLGKRKSPWYRYLDVSDSEQRRTTISCASVSVAMVVDQTAEMRSMPVIEPHVVVKVLVMVHKWVLMQHY